VFPVPITATFFPEETAGRKFVSLIFFAAAAGFPCSINLMNPGMSIPTGQAPTHAGFLQ
jgi:hypothetical protein